MIFIFVTHHDVLIIIITQYNIICTSTKDYQDYQITTITPHGTKDITKNAQIYFLTTTTTSGILICQFVLSKDTSKSKLRHWTHKVN